MRDFLNGDTSRFSRGGFDGMLKLPTTLASNHGQCLGCGRHIRAGQQIWKIGDRQWRCRRCANQVSSRAR